MANAAYELITNYIYIYQLGVYVIIPTYPESIQDSLGSTFAQENILSRTAPVQSYSYSGPRQVQINLVLHRDLMNSMNYKNLSFLNPETGKKDLKLIDEVEGSLNDDYVDTLIKYLQAMALPSYSSITNASEVYSKMVNPPLVACRFGNEVFIKGIINGDVSVTYEGPLTQDNKYTQVTVGFNIVETEPQDAEQLAKNGSFRGLSMLLTKGLYK